MVSSITPASYTIQSTHSDTKSPVPIDSRQSKDPAQAVSQTALNIPVRPEQRRTPDSAVFPFALEFLLDKDFVQKRYSLSAYRLQERQTLYTPTLPAAIFTSVNEKNTVAIKTAALHEYQNQIEMVPYKQGILVDIYA